jgi:hypothetical protein
MINPLSKFFEKKQLRAEKILKAREGYVSWLEISNSKGWKIYSEAVDKKIENIVKQMTENATLNGEDLKKLQLALCVWREVKRLPSTFEDKAKSK